MSTTCLHSYIFIYSKLTLVIYIYTLRIQSKRLVIMSASLRTQTGLHYLTIQVLNTKVCFIDIWYTSLTSVHYNLEHRLVNITKSFSPLNLNYTTSLVKVWIRSDAKSHAISDLFQACFMSYGYPNFEVFETWSNMYIITVTVVTSKCEMSSSRFFITWTVTSVTLLPLLSMFTILKDTSLRLHYSDSHFAFVRHNKV